LKFGQSLWTIARGQIQSSDTRSIVRSIFEQCCATLLITLLDILLIQGIELCVKHWRFFGYFKWFWAFSCRKKLRSDASSDKFSDSCLIRGRIRTKSLRLGNPIVRTIFLKGQNWYLTSQPMIKGPGFHRVDFMVTTGYMSKPTNFISAHRRAFLEGLLACGGCTMPISIFHYIACSHMYPLFQ
jgi:hypothetical protein